MSSTEQMIRRGEGRTLARRDVLKHGAALGALVWAAPAITQISRVHAQTGGSGTGCDVPTGAENPVIRNSSSPSTYAFTVPTGVTRIRVSAWGGGGGGAYNSAGGGGGGGFASMLINPVVPGTTYEFVVGAGGAGGTVTSEPGVAGSPSTFSSTGIGAAVIVRAGGGGGAVAKTGGTAGGSGVLGNLGTTTNLGGAGGAASGSNGAGGGGSAGYGGPGTVGGASSGNTAGAGGPGGGGGTLGAEYSGAPGGSGGNAVVGQAGTAPGGGGGGGGNKLAGGAGLVGRVRIDLCPPVG